MFRFNSSSMKSNFRKRSFEFSLLSRLLSMSEVTAALRPFYFLVHPDLFAQHPKAQQNNDVNLKLLKSHIDSLINNAHPKPESLKFFLRKHAGYDDGALRIIAVNLNQKSTKALLQVILTTFNLPTKYVDSLKETKTAKPFKFMKWDPSFEEDFDSLNDRKEFHAVKKFLNLYSWLVSNMGEAEQRMRASEPIRQDIEFLRVELLDSLNLEGLTWERGMGTTHLRGTLQGLKSLFFYHPHIKEYLKGRHIHFGNQSGLSVEGIIILSTSEVRDQWMQVISRIDSDQICVNRIPDLQKAVSNVLRDINVTHRSFQPFILGRTYSSNLIRLVTSLGDFMGSQGFPGKWPESLAHLKLVVESATSPMMLSPSGELIVPASCPPCLLVNFITENMQDAKMSIESNKRIVKLESSLHAKAKSTLSLKLLEKDDSISSSQMVSCLQALLSDADRLKPLLQGARLWITQYYSLLLDGEVCIPHDYSDKSVF